MLIINADDLGRSRKETDAALSCFGQGRITSTSAMVFMEDSERAAELARESGIGVGLHLNLNQHYTGSPRSSAAVEAHRRVVRFLGRGRYALLLYHPGLRGAFRDVFQSQIDEFVRLFGKSPSHVDGHQHRHLCWNVIFGKVIPSGMRVRRNFSFFAGEKGVVNRLYRKWVDHLLARRYRVTDYFFALPDCKAGDGLARLADLARQSTVELMTHPVRRDEFDFLMGDSFRELLSALKTGTYALV